jgi:hypothetical protein
MHEPLQRACHRRGPAEAEKTRDPVPGRGAVAPNNENDSARILETAETIASSARFVAVERLA